MYDGICVGGPLDGMVAAHPKDNFKVAEAAHAPPGIYLPVEQRDLSYTYREVADPSAHVAVRFWALEGTSTPRAIEILLRAYNKAAAQRAAEGSVTIPHRGVIS
jgi:hypothetical protein